jgi:hypothetical protein
MVIYGRHLRGFGIVTGNSGIRALRPVFDSGTITSWSSGEMTYIELRRNSFDIILQNKLHGHLILFRVTYEYHTWAPATRKPSNNRLLWPTSARIRNSHW